ncbi:SDR family oxidoreductase [Horticoccus sp. 23ND18S-11]|uniref:SDR family oxidoreductase n=1 Tax=Horticoccus sp. 23ND18S-11 TaxID=3391832 RepID=UPI0039C9B164
MTILLTGASGLVGSAFARAAKRRGHRVIGLVGAFPGAIDGLEVKQQVDLSNDAATTAAVLDAFPEAIVNCAAVSVPEQCDANPALAQALNVTLPTTLARLAHHVSARFVHLSSEQVFDGTHSKPYAATDALAPINLYGRQKIESERAVHAAAADFAVTIRAPLLMGNSVGGQRSNHERLFADWAAGRTPRLFTDEFRQTCTAENLAEVMVELCERQDLRGIFHWAGTELVSRYALGVAIREHFKLTATQAPITAVARAEVPEAARKRQARLALNISPLAGKLKTRPQAVAEQLAELNVPPPCRAWYLGLQ